MPAQPQVVWMTGDVRTEIHLTGGDTGGAFCLLVDHPPAGWSLPPHRHRGIAETIHVLAGQFEIQIDGERSRLSAGQTAHLPGDVVHATCNVGAARGRRLVVFSPGGMERFFLEAGAASADAQVGGAAALAVARRHGWEFVGEAPARG